MNTTFFPQTLPEKTSKLLDRFIQEKSSFLSSFYLSGGTALSLQFGHRESEDLDFFCEQPFDPSDIEHALQTFGKLSETELAKGTLNTFLDGVKLQFLEYPYKILEPFVVWQNIQISSISDIACTKMQTVSMRGNKKDFIDIYFLLKKYSLEELLIFTKKKYIKTNYSEAHILKSLVYFTDADLQPMPRMHKDVLWEQIKETIVNNVKEIQL
jgi:predicted nucleotidyltransferase component of viral defense system